MIQVIPIKRDLDGNAKLRTHVLSPRLGVTLTLTIEGGKENIISILEDHLLETISSVEWNTSEDDTDFTFLTENYNRFIRNLEPQDLVDISVVVSLLRNNILTISAIGNATAYLVEGDDITPIAIPESGRFDFHTLTAGEVSRNAAIYISNQDSLEVLGNEFLFEFSAMNSAEFSEVAKTIFSREINIPFHLVRIAHSFKNVPQQPRQRGRGQLDLIKEKGKDVALKIKELPIWKKAKEKINSVDLGANEKQKYSFLAMGIILIFILIYMLLSAIGGALTTGISGDAFAEKVQQAQTLVEESRKLTGNPDAFTTNMQQAEALLAELRDAQKYLPDAQTIQGDIDALKKEVYGIETIDLTKSESIVPFGESGFRPVATFEVNNKLLLVGKTGIISDYVRGSDLPTIQTYPQNDSAIAATINDAGTLYIVSEATRLMTLRQNNVTYVSVTGQGTWELGSKIKSFNGNIYTINAEQNQIYRYRPSANGFSQKTNSLTAQTSAKILDIAVDGGFYILTEDGKINRFVSTNDKGVVSLTLNKIPGAWKIDSGLSTQIVANDKLSYVYIRNGRTIWIFQPNSRQFQDINSLTYIAQVQIQSDSDVVDLSVPRDGQMYISTEKGIFEAQFQVKDGKFSLTVK